MHAYEKKLVTRIATELRRRFGKQIVRLCVFGSRARGDHGPESDFDILVVVDGKTPEIEHAIMSVFVDEEEGYDIMLTPVIKDRKSFDLEKAHNSPFYQNIEKEGIPL